MLITVWNKKRIIISSKISSLKLINHQVFSSVYKTKIIVLDGRLEGEVYNMESRTTNGSNFINNNHFLNYWFCFGVILDAQTISVWVHSGFISLTTNLCEKTWCHNDLKIEHMEHIHYDACFISNWYVLHFLLKSPPDFGSFPLDVEFPKTKDVAYCGAACSLNRIRQKHRK